MRVQNCVSKGRGYPFLTNDCMRCNYFKFFRYVLLHLIYSRFCHSHCFCSVSWCVLSDAEEQKCLDLAGNATALNIRGTLQCVRGLNTRDCIDKIKVPEENSDGEGGLSCLHYKI